MDADKVYTYTYAEELQDPAIEPKVIITPIAISDIDIPKTIESYKYRMKIFEIHLENEAGEVVQANKPVNVEVDLGDFNADKMEIYHLKKDKTLEKIENFTVVNGKVRFVSSEFSLFFFIDTVDRENDEIAKIDNDTNKQKDASQSEKNSKLEKEKTHADKKDVVKSKSPQTGDSRYAIVYMILMSISALILLKKKGNN